MVVPAWQAHDTGLVAVLPRFRRLAGRVRHHQGSGPTWPERVELDAVDGRLVVTDVGRWPLSSVSVRIVSEGPPVAFVLDLGADGTLLLQAPATPATHALLTTLARQ